MHKKYDLELVVGLTDETKFVEKLALSAAGFLFPNEEAPYRWRAMSPASPVTKGKRASKFEVENGALHGFNGERRVVFQFKKLEVNNREVVVGYLFGSNKGSEAKVAFEKDYFGDSMPGWYAQAHIIASITGEKYTDINHGTVIVGRSNSKETTATTSDTNTPPKARISGGILNGRAIKLPKPSYPAAARHEGASGTVEVIVVLDETGKVIWARARSGHALLRKSAEDAARQARFAVTKLSGEPVTVSGVLLYNFVP